MEIKNYKEINIDVLKDHINTYYVNLPKKQSKIITGVGGYDLFGCALENQLGLKRLKIGSKVPRILRKIKKIIIKKSILGYYYRLIKL